MANDEKETWYLSDLGNTLIKNTAIFYNYLKNQLTKKKVIRTLKYQFVFREGFREAEANTIKRPIKFGHTNTCPKYEAT